MSYATGIVRQARGPNWVDKHRNGPADAAAGARALKWGWPHLNPGLQEAPHMLPTAHSWGASLSRNPQFHRHKVRASGARATTSRGSRARSCRAIQIIDAAFAGGCVT